MAAVFTELGQRMGIPCTLVELPKKRCLTDANAGRCDGVAARVSGLAARGYGNLVQISVSHYTVQHIVFARPEKMRVVTSNMEGLLSALEARHLRIGYLQGSKQAERLLADLPAEQKVALNLPEQAFRMLAAGRISAYLAGPGIVNRALLKGLKAEAPDNPGMQEIEALFVASETPLYPYLHVRHQHRVPDVAASLRSMKADGILDTLFQAAQ